jgi:hypothetical protein
MGASDIGGASLGGNDAGGEANQGGRASQGLGYENGARLRARNWHAEDGASQFIGWRDTQQNIDCSFFLAEDGHTRCLPSTFASLFYADPSCTTPILVFLCATGAGQATVPIPGATSCESTEYRAYDVGPLTTPALIYSNPPACTAVQTPSSFFVYSTAGAEPPTAYVAATESVD